MARTDSLENYLTDVASAIKAKTGKTSAIQASNFDNEIATIETSGGQVDATNVLMGNTNSPIYSSTATLAQIWPVVGRGGVEDFSNTITIDLGKTSILRRLYFISLAVCKGTDVYYFLGSIYIYNNNTSIGVLKHLPLSEEETPPATPLVMAPNAIAGNKIQILGNSAFAGYVAVAGVYWVY